MVTRILSPNVWPIIALSDSYALSHTCLETVNYLSRDCQHQISAVLGGERFLTKMVESKPELMRVGIAFDVQLVAHVFQADYVVEHRLVSFTELEN